MSNSANTSAQQYFYSVSNFTESNVLFIPNQYLYQGSIINVNVIAQSLTFSGSYVTASSVLTISSYTPKVQFDFKSQQVQVIQAGRFNTLPISLSNFICSKSNRRLLSALQSAPVVINFTIYSGNSLNNIITRGTNEMNLENTLNAQYISLKTLSLSTSQGFQYYTYYKIVFNIIDSSTGKQNTDTIITYINKPPIQSIITGGSTVYNLIYDITLSGSGSVIPESTGDTIGYQWNCLSCVSYNFQNCSCPLFVSNYLQTPNLLIPRGKLLPLTMYTYSLTVSATYNGIMRTGYNETFFITTSNSNPSLQTRILNITSNRLYFGAVLNNNGGSNNITYNWSLVEVDTLFPSIQSRNSIKNTTITGFLSTTGNQIDLNSSLMDAPILSQYIPQNVTPNNARMFGIDKSTTIPITTYIYSVTATYPDGTSSLGFAQYTTNLNPRGRTVSISPNTGNGFDTIFSISYSLPSTGDNGQAEFQIFRKDCTGSGEIPVTKMLGSSNIFETVLSPGDSSCNYNVQIIIRAIEYDSFIEYTCNVTVMPSSQSYDVILNSTLQTIPTSMATVDEKIMWITQLSNIVVTQSSSAGQNNLNSIIAQITQMDSLTNSLMDTMTDIEKIAFINTTLSIINKLLNNHKVNLTPTIISTLQAKIYNYTTLLPMLVSGTDLLPVCLQLLNQLTILSQTWNGNTAFLTGLTNSVINVKLNEMPANSPSLTVNSTICEVNLQKVYLEQFNNSLTISSSTGISVNFPGNLTNYINSSILGRTPGNQITIGISLTTTTYNPYPSFRTNTFVNSSLINNTWSSITPSTIASEYDNITKGLIPDKTTIQGGLNLVQLTFVPYQIFPNSSEVPITSTFALGALPAGSYVNFTWPYKYNATQLVNSTIVLPVAFSQENSSWTNQVCNWTQPNDTQGNLVAQCNQLSDPFRNVTETSNSFALALDVLPLAPTSSGPNFYGGGYSLAVIIVIACILAFLILLEYILMKKDEKCMFEAMIKALEERQIPQAPRPPQSCLFDIYEMLVQVRKLGIRNVVHETQQQVFPVTTNAALQDTRMDTTTKDSYISSNGFTRLSPLEEKNIKNLQLDYKECSQSYKNTDIQSAMYDELIDEIPLRRLAQNKLENEVNMAQFSCCTFFIVLPFFNFL